MVRVRKVQVCDSPVGILQHRANGTRANPAFCKRPRIHATFSPGPNKWGASPAFLSDAFPVPPDPLYRVCPSRPAELGLIFRVSFNNVVTVSYTHLTLPTNREV